MNYETLVNCVGWGGVALIIIGIFCVWWPLGIIAIGALGVATAVQMP